MIISSFSDEFRFLSNFYPCRIKYEAIVYPSVENAYQAAKSLNLQERIEISKLSAGKAKRRGSKLQLRVGWSDIKLRIMEDLLREKFGQRDLKALLLATGNSEIIEGNTWGDTYWGVCNGVGENKLGQLIMRIRSELHIH
jgi:hypothetical protein